MQRIFNILNLLIPVLIGIYVFINPLPFSAASEICFYLSLSILIFLAIFKKTSFTLRSPLTMPFVLFSLWAVFGLLFTLDFENTLHDLLCHLLKYLIVFYLLVNYFNSPKKLKILAWVIISSATIFSLGSIIQCYFIEGLPFSSRLGYTFKEMSPDNIGFVTILGTCLCMHFLYENKNLFNKIFYGICIFVLSITTLLTQSRASLLGLMAALAILFFYNRKIIIPTAIVLMIILMPGIRERVTNIDGYTKDLRIKINYLTIKVIKKHPFVGIGFGMQIYGNKNVLDLQTINKQLPPEYQQKDKVIASPHNTILDFAVRTGIIGLLLYLYIIITAIRMLWQTLNLRTNKTFKPWTTCLCACFVSFLIPALFTDTSFGVRAIVFYSILAMINILWNLVQKEKIGCTVQLS